ncbi:hypothetical protein M9H77_07987 [Catharanthus roseus]|uniref:Uncharacterized protein n=1 Tax=Catharanthus roseus TaxID=4058 RepID=A0ACC0BWR2_CATRO|nr:hypothetical protein M9H77_07987 [Catharanthus roseus]
MEASPIPQILKEDLNSQTTLTRKLFCFSETYLPSLHIPTTTIASEKPIRPKRSLALGHDDRALSPLARTRYSSPGSSSTATLSTTPATPVIRMINFLSLGHYLGSPDELLLMCRLRLPGTGMEEEANFDKMTKVLIGDTGAIWPKTNRLISNLIKMSYKALFRVFYGNWLPTTNVTAVLKKRAHMLYAFITRKRINICIVSAMDPLVMPKIVALGVVPPSPTPSTPGHIAPCRSTRQQSSKKKQHNTKMASPSSPAPNTETSEVTTNLDLLNQQLSTIMASVLQMQQDL